MNTNEAQGACDLCRDIQRDTTGELAEIYDVRNHTHCGVCPAELLASEAAGNASCTLEDGAWRWEVSWIPVDVDATPAPAIGAETAKILNLGHDPETRKIGYWRSAETPKAEGSWPYGPSVARARNDLESWRGGRLNYTVNGLSVAEMGPWLEGEIERLEGRAKAWGSLPWPGDHVDPDMSAQDRELIAAKLDAAPVVARYCGSSFDRLGDACVGSSERQACGWTWPSGLSHYVREYGLRLDPEFLDAISSINP